MFLCLALHVCDEKHPDYAGDIRGCCTSENPCPLHVGDCQHDFECQGHLTCTIRNQGKIFGYSSNLINVCGEGNTINTVFSNEQFSISKSEAPSLLCQIVFTTVFFPHPYQRG